jgi:hypothetical protein
MTSWAATIRDVAIQTAKGRAHSAVGPRHVVFAVCSLLRRRTEIAPLLAQAQELLGGRGGAFVTPALDADAEAMLAQCGDEVAALEVARRWLESARSGGADSPAGSVAVRLVRSKAEAPAEGTRSMGPAPGSGPTRIETLEAVLLDLDRLVGLETVKSRIRQLMALVKANMVRTREGMPAVSSSLHLVFTGSPGTGKTTVARLVARLYAALGVIPDAKFLEVKRVDLVAAYVGQTSIKTQELIQRVRPGVLFIDEAYSLASGGSQDFGAEALATLLVEMEKNRSDLAVIVAGYGKEMEGFIGSNPGLASRFKTIIEFPNYTPEELVRVFLGFAKEHHVDLVDGVTDELEKAFRKASDEHQSDCDLFGNARVARNLFEEAFQHRASRAYADGDVQLAEVTGLDREDVQAAAKALLSNPVRRIGFGSTR